MDKTTAEQLKATEASLKEAEKRLGTQHPDVADLLMKYAGLLRQVEGRTLDAVNVEARAKAIRAKLYAEEAEMVASKTSTVVIKPKESPPVGPGVYAGLAGLLIAVCTLFLSQTHFLLLAITAIVLLVVDIVLTRGGGWWRGLIGSVFIGTSYFCMQSIPPIMLTDASPMERFNYLAENSTLVENVRKLGETHTAGNYSFALPPDYSSLDYRKPDWGESYEWRTPLRADDSFGDFRMLMVQPDTVSKNYSTLSVTRLAKDVAMPLVVKELGMDVVTEQSPTTEELNGFNFARILWDGSDDERKKAGVTYVAKEKDRLLILVGADWHPESDQTIPQMEAVVYTFNRIAGKQKPVAGQDDGTSGTTGGTDTDGGAAESTSDNNADQ
jgi:hypothetical protein